MMLMVAVVVVVVVTGTRWHSSSSCRASHTRDAIRVMYSSVSFCVALHVRAGAEHSVMVLSYLIL